jgi:hypothetical protein
MRCPSGYRDDKSFFYLIVPERTKNLLGRVRKASTQLK